MNPYLSALVDELVEPVSPFTTLTPSQVIENGEPDEPPILLNATGIPILRMGMTAGLVGPAGVGKSRLALYLAVTNIIGEPFLAFQQGPPLRWLLISNENSPGRCYRDLFDIRQVFPAGVQDRLDANLHILVPLTREDLFIQIAGQEDKWRATIEAVKPDVIVVDPFEALLDGDPNDSVKVREAIMMLRQVAGMERTLLFVHHSRTSSMDLRQAVGFDRGNFVKGSKTFASICRLVINVAPGDSADSGKLLIACGKINDSRGFDPFGVVYNEDGITFSVDEDFDLEAWMDDVEGKRKKSLVSIEDVVFAVKDTDGTRKAVLDQLAHIGCNPRTITRKIDDAVDKGFLEKTATGCWKLGPKGKAHAREVGRAYRMLNPQPGVVHDDKKN